MFTAFSSFARRATSTFMFARLFAAEFIALLVVVVLPSTFPSEVNLHAIKRNQIEFRPPRCHRFDSESLRIFDPIRIISGTETRFSSKFFGANPSSPCLFPRTPSLVCLWATTYHHPECSEGEARRVGKKSIWAVHVAAVAGPP